MHNASAFTQRTPGVAAFKQTVEQVPCCPPSAAETLPDQPGHYGLILRLQRASSLRIGRLDHVQFPSGVYLYVGSARGPGGLRARVRRHLKPASQKRRHWHIDALRATAPTLDVWWATENVAVECQWAELLADVGRRLPPGFGASDCRCPGHLIHLEDAQALASGWTRLQAETSQALSRLRGNTKHR